MRLAWDERALHVRFDCADRDAWGTYRERDDPLYEEEVVEVFLAPGEADPRRYVELEVSPAGVLFIRSYERGERVHLAMLSRGYDGHLPR